MKTLIHSYEVSVIIIIQTSIKIFLNLVKPFTNVPNVPIRRCLEQHKGNNTNTREISEHFLKFFKFN